MGLLTGTSEDYNTGMYRMVKNADSNRIMKKQQEYI